MLSTSPTARAKLAIKAILTVLVLAFVELESGRSADAANTLMALNEYEESPANLDAVAQLHAVAELRNLSLAEGLAPRSAIPVGPALEEPAGAPAEDALGEALASALF